MGLGVSFRVAPGVRVRASTRGMRTSIGPRGARLHVGSGRTRISTGIGPITVSTPLNEGLRSRTSASQTASAISARPRRSTVAQLQVQDRAAQRAQQVADVAAHERALTSLHLSTFRDATRQEVPVPQAPTASTVDAVRDELARAACDGLAWWRRAPRRQAKAWAAQTAPVEAQRRFTGALIAAQQEQAAMDIAWAALRNHEAYAVVAAVDEAFADNASDATCVDADIDPDTGHRYVTAVVAYGGVELVSEYRPDVTPGGKATLRKRTKTDRNAVYATSMASTALATAKEALAVAVAADQVRVLVVREASRGGVEPVFAAIFNRSALRGVDWRSVDPLTLAMAAQSATMVRKGSTGEVAALAVEPGSPTQELLDAWSQS